jgi:acetylornithine deacetylase
VWDVRAVDAEHDASATRRLRALAETLKSELSTRDPALEILTQTLASVPALIGHRHHGCSAIERAMTGRQRISLPFATEAGYFEREGLLTVICGPGEIAQAHTADEFVTIEQLRECGVMLRSVMHDLGSCEADSA